ncbi:hypothetical protein [Massilia sp. H6]|uniref:hypothetical protein n=1 Tax=Massilia sp. H6 TaxID=2970464 RepID=UPI0021684383|nr:hypothetical protein [Massilia sp. H6]UVW27449.1 hypothetical protein NRS07_12910 [Massilia sp. H6]
MFSKRFMAASAVAITSFASSAGEPPAALAAADPAARVSPTRYTSALSSYMPHKAPAVSPDKVWREANARVAGEGMHGHAHGGHGAPAEPAEPARLANPDPHAGHQMNHDKQPAAAVRPAPATHASDAASHDQHQHHHQHQRHVQEAKK